MCYVCPQPCHLVINRLKNWLLSCSSVANFPERSKLKSAEASTKICQVYPGEQTTPEISNLNLAQVPSTISKVNSGAPEQQDVPGGLSPLLGLIGQHVPAKKISAKAPSTDIHLRWEIQNCSSNKKLRQVLIFDQIQVACSYPPSSDPLKPPGQCEVSLTWN